MREPTSHPLRVLFLTLEFRHGTFSGNGVLSSSQAHGLAKAGHAVLVVSGCPDDVNHDEESANLSDALPAAGEVSVRTLHVPGTKWGVLTSQCPWVELAESAQLATALHAQIAAFAPHVVLGIDWHVTPTWRALRKRVWPRIHRTANPWTPTRHHLARTRRSCTATTACSPGTGTGRTRRWNERRSRRPSQQSR